MRRCSPPISISFPGGNRWQPQVANPSSHITSQRQSIHTHRTLFQIYQELAGWNADWPIKVPDPHPTDADPRKSLESRQRFYNTYPDRWSPMQITEFISEAVTKQTAYDRNGRMVHPSAFVDNLPWSFFSASRLATVPRLAYFARSHPHKTNIRQPSFDSVGHRSDDSQEGNTVKVCEGPLSIMFHGSPNGLDILKRGARFMHNKDDAQGIYLSPSLASARGYADILKAVVTCDSLRDSASRKKRNNGEPSAADSSNWLNAEIARCSGADGRIVSSVSAAALRQRGVLVCLVALGKVYHRYAQQNPEVERLIQEGKWAMEGTTRSDAALNAAKSLKEAASSIRPSGHYGYGTGRGGQDGERGRGGSASNRRTSNQCNPNDDPLRLYDSYVDFVDGEQVYCVRNPDNIIPVVALALNKQSGLDSR